MLFVWYQDSEASKHDFQKRLVYWFDQIQQVNLGDDGDNIGERRVFLDSCCLMEARKGFKDIPFVLKIVHILLFTSLQILVSKRCLYKEIVSYLMSKSLVYILKHKLGFFWIFEFLYNIVEN
jgi:hypothetical protein